MVMKERKNSRVNVHSVISFLSILQNYKLIDYLKEAGIPHTSYIIEYPKILQVKKIFLWNKFRKLWFLDE